MKIVTIKKRRLLDSYSASYLLRVVSNYVVTNENYEELLLLDYNLEKVVTIRSSEDTIMAHNVFQDAQSSRLLFEFEEKDFLLVFDAKALRLYTIRSEEICDLLISSPYVWPNHYFLAFDYHGQELIKIDTEGYELEFASLEEGFKLTPELERLKEVDESIQACAYNYEERVFIVRDYKESKTVTIIGFDGKVLRKISIAKELPADFRLKPNGAPYRSDWIPHEIRYQDGWIILVWKGKVVIVSPCNRRVTRYPEDERMFARVRFLKTSPQTMHCVVLVSDIKYVDSSSLERWHVGVN